MKINYIKEDYFKNPQQLKAAAERRANISNADRMATTSNEIIKQDAERILDAFLERGKPEGRLDSTGEYSDWRLLIPRKVAGQMCRIFYVDYIGMENMTGPATQLKSEIIKIENNKVFIDIHIRVIDDAWLKHIRERQEKSALEKEGKNPADVGPIGQYLELFDAATDVEPNDMYNTIRQDIKEDFYTEINFWAALKHDNVSKTSLSYQMMFGHGKKLVLNRIHMFEGIEGDIIINGDLARGWNAETTKSLRKYIVNSFNNITTLFSFENTGNVIIRDRFRREKDIVIKKNTILNEGYFNNPEQAKAIADRKNQLTNIEKLASLSTETIYRRVEEIFDEILNNPSAFCYDRSVDGNKDYRTLLPKGIFGYEASYLFYIPYALVATPTTNERCRYKTKVKINDSEGTITVDVYVMICNNVWLNRVKKTQNQTYFDKSINEYVKRWHLGSNIEMFDNELMEGVFSDSMEYNIEKLKKQNKKDSIYEFINEYLIKLGTIHMFSEIDGDIIVITGISSEDGDESTSRENIILRTEMLPSNFSFENTGKIVLMDSSVEYDDIIIKGNE